MNLNSEEYDLLAMKEKMEKLSEQQSYMILKINMMQELSKVSGIDDTTNMLLKIVKQNIGGSGIVLYYQINDELFCREYKHKIKKISTITDINIKKVFKKHSLIEIKENKKNEPNNNTWIFPIKTEEYFCGALQIDGLSLLNSDLKNVFTSFLDFAANILRHVFQYHSDIIRMQEEYRKEVELNEEIATKSDLYSSMYEEYLTIYDEIKNTTENLYFANEKVRQSENTLHAILSGTPIPQFVIDKNHKVIQWNEALEIYSGIPAKVILGTNQHWRAFYSNERPCLADLLVDNKIDDILTMYDGKFPKPSYIKDSYEATDFFPNIGKEGTWFHYTAAVIRDTENNIIGAIETLEDVSQKKKAEIELQQSEEKYRLIFEYTPLGLFSFDDKGNITTCNKSLIKIIGVPLSHFLQINILKLPDKKIVALTKNTLKGKFELYEGDYFSVLAEKTICSRWLFAPLKNAGGKVIGGTVILEDISERKNFERALKDSEERYRFIAENTADTISVYDIDLNLIYISPAIKKLRGYTQEEAMKLSQSNVFTPESLKKIKEYHEYIKKEGFRTGKATSSPLVLELEGYRKDGSVNWVESTISLQKDNNNKIDKIIVVSRDITHRKQADEALRRSEEKYRIIAENTADTIAIFDLNLKPKYFSPAIKKMRGYLPEEAINLPLKKMVTTDSFKKIKQLFVEQMDIEASGKGDPYRSATLELEEYRKDGSIIITEVASSFLRDADLRPIGFITISRDITERKQAEEAIRKSEEKYRLIFEHSPLGLLSLDNNGIIVACNNNLASYLGSTKEKLIGFDICKVRNNNLVKAARKSLVGGFGFYEGPYISLNGNKQIFVRCLFAPVKYKGIGIYGSVGIVEDISEALEKEKLLEISEERFQQVTENAQEWIWEIDENGLYTYSSPVVKKILGYEVDEIVGKKHFHDFIHPDDKEEIKRLSLKNFKYKKPFSEFLNRNIGKNGEIVYLSTSGVPILNEKGNLKGYRGADVNITKRHKAEEALRESEERYRLIAENTADTIAVYDLNLRPLYIIPSVQKMRGFTVEEALSQSMEQTFTSESFKKIKEVIAQQLSFDKKKISVPSKVVMMELETYCKDKSTIWVEVALSAIKNPDNKSTGILLVTRNINKRKLAENALRESEVKFRTVADYSYDWEYWIGADGDILYMSPSVERITGYTIDEFKVNPGLIRQIIFDGDTELFEDRIKTRKESFSPENQNTIDFRIITKSGEIRWISHTNREIFVDGKYLGHRVSNRDITEKVKSENDLFNLTVKVEERERNRFSREIHDGLGPLLSTVKLYFQWLAETKDPEKIKFITERGNTNIDRAIITTREIAHGLSSSLINNAGFVEAMLDFIQIINETNKIKIDFSFNTNKRFVNTLEITLYRITSELINNTLKYAKANNIKILFNFEEDKYITLTYMDDGVGFNLHHVENNSRGLGLLNIKNKVKLLKGNMKIKTDIGKGTNIEIELPVNANNL